MALIHHATFADFGYRKLEPSGTFLPTTLERLAEYARSRAQFEVASDGHSRWIRHADRKAGPIRPLMREVASIERNTANPAAALHCVEAFDAAWGTIEGRYSSPVKDCAALCKDALNEPAHRGLHFLTCAASLAPRPVLRHVLAQHVLPAFFKIARDGYFLAYAVDYELEIRLGLCRNLHRFSQYSLSDLDKDDVASLQKLHAESSLEQPALIVNLVSALTYPWVTCVAAVRPGLLFVFVLDPAPKHEAQRFPSSWSDKLRSSADFAKNSVGLTELLRSKDEAVKESARHRRHRLVDPPPAAQSLSLLRYTLERYARTVWHTTDPSEHCAPGTDAISPLVPFEFGLTLDRLVRKGVLSVFGTAEIDRKDDCFEIADLIEELWSQRNDKSAGTAIFKRLFTRNEAIPLLNSCVSGAPIHDWPPIVPAVRATYDRLVSVVEASVTVKSKVTPGGILVRNKSLTREVVEPLDEFAANVVRALRNAHHGYLTAHDRSSRPARYLSLVDGSIPNEVSLIAAYWVWCTVTSPEVVLGRPWLPVGGYVA